MALADPFLTDPPEVSPRPRLDRATEEDRELPVLTLPLPLALATVLARLPRSAAEAVPPEADTEALALALVPSRSRRRGRRGISASVGGGALISSSRGISDPSSSFMLLSPVYSN